MSDNDQLINQAKQQMRCPACGQTYQPQAISLQGSLEHTWVLSAECQRDHPVVYTTWITSYIPPQSSASIPLKADDAITLHQALKRFNGDFAALWPEKGSHGNNHS